MEITSFLAALSDSAYDPLMLARMHEWCLLFRARKGKRTYFAVKKVIDFTVSLALILALSPLFLFCAIATWIEAGTPVLFKQLRYGEFGKPFLVYKFRTMTRKNGVLAVTRFGEIMRRFKLDELPQLLNVLLGEMSLVGPRPLMSLDMARLNHQRFMRLAVKPGMTGLWQALHSNLISLRMKHRYDEFYAINCGFRLDLWLLFKTLPMVMRGEDQIVHRQKAATSTVSLDRKAG